MFGRVWVAGHRGMVGAAVVRRLQRLLPAPELLLRTHAELDLTDAAATLAFVERERPAVVVVAAARVGGIVANATQPWRFIHENLAIASHVIDAARRFGVQRLLFLGSSCIYPRDAAQPLTESALLTGPLEATNRPYALAKIAGIELCWAANREHGTRFLSVMPCNLYGEGDTYEPEMGHVIPALIDRFHRATQRGDPEVVVWGSGEPLREFLHCDDLADACVHLLGLPDAGFDALLGDRRLDAPSFAPPLVNIGSGQEIRIADLAGRIAAVVGYGGRIVQDRSRPDGTPRKLLDSSRLRATGWSPSIGLEEGLQRAWADYRARHCAAG